MKSFSAAIACLLALLPAAWAQVKVEIVLEQDQFLPGETLRAGVRITNRSGQTLNLGEEADWLAFTIESRDDFPVVKDSDPPVKGAFTLESSEVGTKWVNLAPYYNLIQPGHYTVTATVRIRQWNEQAVSDAKGFDIIQGAKLWSRDFGVPPLPGVTNRAPEMRRYTLEQANYLRRQIKIYLRLTDVTEAKVFKVFPIGPLPAFNQVEPQLDRYSNLHLLYQVGARAFSYTVVDPDGDIILRQTYDYVSSRPRLQTDKEGRLVVIGGVRHPTVNDVPPPAPPAGTAIPPKG